MKKMENVAGFNLGETLTALFILSLGILAALAMITASLNSAIVVQDNLTASNLVQEGVEVVRNMRDRDWLAGNSFGAFLASAGGNGDYRVQWNSTNLLSDLGNPVLLQDTTSGLYSYDSGNSTKFKRRLTITKLANNIEIKIISTVSWNNRGVSKQVSAEEHLFDWY